MSYSNHSPCYTLHTVKERSPDHISYSHSPFTMLLITQSITIHHIVHPRVSRSVCYTSNRHQLPQSTSNSHHLPQYISSSHHSPCYALHSDTCIKWIKVKYVQERQYSMDEMKAHERVTMDKVKMCQKNDTVLCKRWRHTKQSPCSEDKSTHHLPYATHQWSDCASEHGLQLCKNCQTSAWDPECQGWCGSWQGRELRKELVWQGRISLALSCWILAKVGRNSSACMFAHHHLFPVVNITYNKWATVM